MPKVGEKSQENDKALSKLVATINEQHKLGLAAEKKSTDHYIKAGMALSKAKEEVKKQFGPKAWTTWFNENCKGLSMRQAQRYMSLADPKTDVTSFSTPEEHRQQVMGNATRTRAAPRKTEDDNDPALPIPTGLDEHIIDAHIAEERAFARFMEMCAASAVIRLSGVEIEICLKGDRYLVSMYPYGDVPTSNSFSEHATIKQGRLWAWCEYRRWDIHKHLSNWTPDERAKVD